MIHKAGPIALVVSLLACACSTEPKPPAQDPPGQGDGDAAPEPPPVDAAEPEEDTAIRFAASEAAAESEMFQEELGLLEQRDIIAVLDLPDASGVQFVRMDIRNPQGVLHQTIWRAISSDADAPDTVLHPDIGQKMPVTRVTAEDGLVRLHIAIPIAGTSFTQFRLTGTFTTEAWVGMGDGAPLRTGHFTMVL